MKNKKLFIFLSVVSFHLSTAFAYFEDSPQSFSKLSFADSPASFSGTKLDMVYHLPYRGIDEDFSSYYLGASWEGRKLAVGFSRSDFGFDSVYNEQITRLSLGWKVNNAWKTGIALKQFAIKFSPDSYTSDDPYFSKTSAAAMDADIGAVKQTSKGDIAFNITNLLGSGIGLVGTEPLNRIVSVGWSLPFSVFNRRHLFFAELAANDSDNFESFDYRSALESRIASNAVFRMAFDRYYFVPSAEFSYPLEGKYDIGAGFAYRYPYNTFNGFTQFTTLITIRKKIKTDTGSALMKENEIKNEKSDGAESKAAREETSEPARLMKGKYFNTAVKYYESGEYEKAIEQWEKLLEMEPEHSESKRLIKKSREKLNETK
ncbi:tetratricopeptide repeat protein [bacterium]|nr:tetratricopeptide repeat protein [bacterium]MBU3955127.1 tetratricopeptide repeat protein [bacterium]MBU4133852.1 tetratricopeptide repeat protein [bacterium]